MSQRHAAVAPLVSLVFPPATDLCAVFLFSAIPGLLGGHLLQAPADPAAEVRHLLLDSRRVGLPAGALFFALRGPSHNGHRYLPDLYAQGVRLFVVEAGAPLPGGLAAYPQAGIVAVASPLAALQAVAAAHRATPGARATSPMRSSCFQVSALSCRSNSRSYSTMPVATFEAMEQSCFLLSSLRLYRGTLGSKLYRRSAPRS